MIEVDLTKNLAESLAEYALIYGADDEALVTLISYKDLREQADHPISKSVLLAITSALTEKEQSSVTALIKCKIRVTFTTMLDRTKHSEFEKELAKSVNDDWALTPQSTDIQSFIPVKKTTPSFFEKIGSYFFKKSLVVADLVVEKKIPQQSFKTVSERIDFLTKKCMVDSILNKESGIYLVDHEIYF